MHFKKMNERERERGRDREREPTKYMAVENFLILNKEIVELLV